MAALNSKLRSVAFDINRVRIGIAHWCPGCDQAHAICTAGGTKGPRWHWDGSITKPDVVPSVRITSRNAGVETVCHYFLRLGRIEFCADSTHALAGQTVDLPDWPTNRDEATFYLAPPHDFTKLQ